MNLQLLLESVSFHFRAEHLIDSFHYGSSINLKAEVTLNVGKCPEDTLLHNMEESALKLTSWGSRPIGDVESRMHICALILFWDIYFLSLQFLYFLTVYAYLNGLMFMLELSWSIFILFSMYVFFMLKLTILVLSLRYICTHPCF